MTVSPFQIDLDRTKVLFCNLDLDVYSTVIDNRFRVVSSVFCVIMALQDGDIIAVNLGVGCYIWILATDAEFFKTFLFYFHF